MTKQKLSPSAFCSFPTHQTKQRRTRDLVLILSDWCYCVFEPLHWSLRVLVIWPFRQFSTSPFFPVFVFRVLCSCNLGHCSQDIESKKLFSPVSFCFSSRNRMGSATPTTVIHQPNFPTLTKQTPQAGAFSRSKGRK